jgi:AcrR family transcriptional regulator
MANRKNPDSIKTKQQILEAARDAFIDQGITSTSLKEIARTAGVSTGTLFYYYASKSDLVFDVTNLHFDQLTHQLLDWVNSINSQSNMQKILPVVCETIVGDQLRGKLHHYLIEEALTNNSSLRIKFIEKYTEWQTMIEQGIEISVPDKKKRREIAQLLLAVLDGLVMQTILGVEGISIKDISLQLARTISS